MALKNDVLPQTHAYFSILIVLIVLVLQAILTHELLEGRYLLLLYVFLCFSAICCLYTLSKVCVIRRKDKSAEKQIWELCDSDLESEAEYEDFENESNWLKRRKKQFFMFMEYKPIYGLVFKVAVFFIVMSFVMKGASFCYPSMEQDLHISFLMLAVNGIFLMIAIFIASGMPRPEPIKYTYEPFDEEIDIPMRVFVPKVILHLTRRFLYVFSVLFYMSAALYGLITVRKMPQREVQRFKDVTEFEDIRKYMILIMYICNLCGVVLLVENIVTAYFMAKEDMLLTFEKNWRRNMVALEYFLPEKEFASLDELRDAFLEKTQRKDLTDVDKKILKYIEIPLWKSKRNFLPRRLEGNGVPKELQSDWPLESPAENEDEETSPPPSEVLDNEISSPPPIPRPRVTRSRARLQ